MKLKNQDQDYSLNRFTDYQTCFPSSTRFLNPCRYQEPTCLLDHKIKKTQQKTIQTIQRKQTCILISLIKMCQKNTTYNMFFFFFFFLKHNRLKHSFTHCPTLLPHQTPSQKHKVHCLVRLALSILKVEKLIINIYLEHGQLHFSYLYPRD